MKSRTYKETFLRKKEQLLWKVSSELSIFNPRKTINKKYKLIQLQRIINRNSLNEIYYLFLKVSISGTLLGSNTTLENPSMLVKFVNRPYHDNQNNLRKIYR